MKNPGKFVEDFSTLTRLAQYGMEQAKGSELLLDAMTEHLGAPAHDLSVVTQDVPAHRLVDLDIILEPTLPARFQEPRHRP